MIYGLWLSATGVVTTNHQTDVIANNLANAETAGFKRQLAAFVERAPEGKAHPGLHRGDPRLDRIGGGQLLAPSTFDLSEGVFEDTGQNLDLALTGDGFFAVRDARGETRLTRNGNMMLDREGNLVLATATGEAVLDQQQQPIRVDPEGGVSSSELHIADDGSISAGDQPLGRIGLFTIADPKQLRPEGGTLLKPPANAELQQSTAAVNPGYLERSNVDPAVELTRLMENQRQMEANANMIRYQDQTLSALVNTVGKIA